MRSKEETMYLEVDTPVFRYIAHMELRMRYPNILTTDSLGNSKKVIYASSLLFILLVLCTLRIAL